MVTMHVSLDRANLNAINILNPDFLIWQHFDDNWTTAHHTTLQTCDHAL